MKMNEPVGKAETIEFKLNGDTISAFAGETIIQAASRHGVEIPFGGPAGEVIRTAEGVADLEYAVRTHELLKRWFGRSLKLHIILSVVLYTLLALHIGSGIYFGLRWLR